MTHNEYINLKIGDYVTIKGRSVNAGRKCQLVWKDLEGYACVIPADTNQPFKLPTDRYGSKRMLILYLNCIDVCKT